jgi:NOL1/NOP2/fmu family ribosome biogenesis protein
LTNLFKHKDTIYELSLPLEDYQYLNNFLRIIKGGTALFKTRRDDIIPMHELALYCKMRKDAFPIVELDYQQSISFLRKENIILKDSVKGWILLNFRGVNLGFAKNIGSRINNYFPVDWRIRLADSSLSSDTIVCWE